MSKNVAGASYTKCPRTPAVVVCGSLRMLHNGLRTLTKLRLHFLNVRESLQ